MFVWDDAAIRKTRAHIMMVNFTRIKIYIVRGLTYFEFPHGAANS